MLNNFHPDCMADLATMSVSEKKFFRSERPLQVGTTRPGPPQKQTPTRKAKSLIMDNHQDANSGETGGKNLNKSFGSLKDDIESDVSSLKKQTIPEEIKTSTPKQEVLKHCVTGNTMKSNSKPRGRKESSSSDLSSTTPPKAPPVKRRVPAKNRVKINKMTGSRLNENTSFKALTDRANRIGYESSLNASDSDSSEDEMRDFGKEVNHLMVQLQSKIQNRIEIRTDKLNKAFEHVRCIPPKIRKFELDQSQRKQSLVQDFHTELAKIHGKLDDIVKLQANNVSECSKLFDEGTAAHENNKKSIADCKQQHNSALTNFFKEEEKLRSQFTDEEKRSLEQNNKEIRKLRTKLILEGELHSSEVLRKL